MHKCIKISRVGALNACLYIKKCPDPWVSTITVRHHMSDLVTIGDDHCLAIGRITVAFAQLESWLSSFIWSLIGPFSEQHVGQIITAEMSFRQKLDVLM